ncbi:NUDIX hydrolase [Streptomyces sparsogenes]|uniref:NUDIX hydrolase n=1 Tax=Streptomyces sparsogenes TaxID=67365 RepID=UPI0033F5A483
MAGKPVIRAAGCVLWRRSARDGRPEIALVHRPRYDDWSHPKGKLKRGEDALRGAVREVREETGVRCVPGPELPTVRYPVKGRPKEVRYWAAEAVPGRPGRPGHPDEPDEPDERDEPGRGFVPNDEVDRLVWLPPEEARERLTHAHDRALVDALLDAVTWPET